MSDVVSPPPVAPSVARRLTSLRRVLETWGPVEGRTYPWRETGDPYLRLIAELLLQRTRADAVAAVWREFVREFGAPGLLAAASEEQIALAIRPLGLSRKRARYLKRLGRSLSEVATFPTDPLALAALPGVGPYSAGAFLTSWRGARTAPVDANVRRVIGRVALGVSVADRRHAEPLVRRLLVRGSATTILYALLDFGASPCRPRTPDCRGCPARAFCAFRRARLSIEHPTPPQAIGTAQTLA
jgi:A/G-specific adenine glycosylase